MENTSTDDATTLSSHIVGLFLLRNDRFIVAVRSFGFKGTRIEIATTSDLTTKKVSKIIKRLSECTVAVHATKADPEHIWFMCEFDGVFTMDIGSMLEQFKDKHCKQLEVHEERLIPFGGSWRGSMRTAMWDDVADMYRGMTITEDGEQLALLINVSHNLRLVLVDAVNYRLDHEERLSVRHDCRANMQFTADGMNLIFIITGHFLKVYSKDTNGFWFRSTIEEVQCFDISRRTNIYACGVTCISTNIYHGNLDNTEKFSTPDIVTLDDKNATTTMHDIILTPEDRYVVAFFADKHTGRRYQRVVELKTGKVVRRLNIMDDAIMEKHTSKRHCYDYNDGLLHQIPSQPVFDRKGHTLFVGLPNDKSFTSVQLYENRAPVWLTLLQSASERLGRDKYLYTYIFSYLRCWFIIQDDV